MIALAVVFVFFAALLGVAELLTRLHRLLRRHAPIEVTQTPEHVVSLWARRRRPFDYEQDGL